MSFVNRTEEISRLQEWWSAKGSQLALVWGRRRVGKTALLQEFSGNLPAVFHTGTSRPAPDELRELSRVSIPVLEPGFRDVGARPFADWQDAFETFAEAARGSPMLLVLDEFPEIDELREEFGNTVTDFEKTVSSLRERMQETYSQLRQRLESISVDVDNYPAPDPELVNETNSLLFVSGRTYLAQLESYAAYQNGHSVN